MAVSSFANTRLEEVVQQGEGRIDYCMQMYVVRDRALGRQLVKMAEGQSFSCSTRGHVHLLT